MLLRDKCVVIKMGEKRRRYKNLFLLRSWSYWNGLVMKLLFQIMMMYSWGNNGRQVWEEDARVFWRQGVCQTWYLLLLQIVSGWSGSRVYYIWQGYVHYAWMVKLKMISVGGVPKKVKTNNIKIVTCLIDTCPNVIVNNPGTFSLIKMILFLLV